jgi:hypothetical protein
MNKCVEYLAFINPKTGEIKERFELEFTEKELLQGRRPQLLKKLIDKAIDDKWLKSWQLYKHLKQTNRINFVDLLKYASTADDPEDD